MSLVSASPVRASPISTSIVLVRHGQPDIGAWPWLSRQDFANWIAAYNHAPLTSLAPAPSLHAALNQPFVVCSDLRRSRDSAAALGFVPQQVDALYREAELPVLAWRGPRLPLGVWLLACRLSWLLGYSPHVEPRAALQQRANLAAAQLIATAQQHGQVVLLGHGILNTFIAKALAQKGWHSPHPAPKKHWHFSTYTQRTA